jgi:TusA-related sulfurtransferase
MASVELDLRGVVLPICLLKCKTALMGMEPREELDILISDPHVVEDLVKIIKRSQGMAVRPRREGDHYRLHISG